MAVGRPVATAPIGPLAWESPYAMGAAQEIAKRQKKEKEKEKKSKTTQIYGKTYHALGLE